MQNRNKEMLKNLLIKPFLRCETVHVNTLELKVFNVVRPLHVVLHVCLHLTGVFVCTIFSVCVCVCVSLLQPRHEYFNVPVYWLAAACWATPPARLTPPLSQHRPIRELHLGPSFSCTQSDSVSLCLSVCWSFISTDFIPLSYSSSSLNAWITLIGGRHRFFTLTNGHDFKFSELIMKSSV